MANHLLAPHTISERVERLDNAGRLMRWMARRCWPLWGIVITGPWTSGEWGGRGFSQHDGVCASRGRGARHLVGLGDEERQRQIALRGVVETVEDESDSLLDERRRAVLDSWVIGLDRLAGARAEEGARLGALLRGQLAETLALVEGAAGCAAAQPAAIRGRLQTMMANLADLVAGVPEERVAQEIALLVARSDIREELERLRAHIEQASDLLQQGEAVGRRLDFLCQELNREANTLCSKSADIELTRIGLALKAGVEQFREQVQNIE